MKIKKIFICNLALLIAILFGTQISAQDIGDTLTLDDLFEMDLEELLELEVVSSSKSSQKVAIAPNVISVCNSSQIRALEWNSLNDILYKHQGFFPFQDFERRTVGFRGNFEGWNNNHLLLLIDGVPFNDNLYGTAYTWEITPLSFTKSVEIIRGTGAALYGTNATNGVLTMNTLSYSDFGKKKIFATASYGEKNTHNYNLMSGFKTKLFTNVTSFNFFKTDGLDELSYDGSGELNENGVLQKFHVKDKRQSSYLFTKFEGTGKLYGLNIQYHHQQWNYETGHGWLWNIPDNDETMKENRDIIMAKYTGKISKNIEQEYVVRYQIHRIDWDMWYYRENAYAGFYPNGVNEYLKSQAQDVFTRIQYKYLLPKNSHILTAIETTTFYYNGDKEHYTNTDLNDEGNFIMDDGTEVPSYEGWYAPFPNNENRTYGPWFEFIDGKTVNTISGFIQYSSGNLFGNYIQMTTGMRYDIEFFDYIDIYDENKSEKSKNFKEFSPRVALIFLPNDDFTIKLMGGKGFRAPTPTEMFGSNTWTLASNLNELEPERLLNAELALDYKITKNIVARLNGFYTVFEGQIAYSLGNNNLSTNIYTTENIGLESELFFTSKSMFGFLNYSFVKRIGEEIYEKEQENVSVHDDKVTWVPSMTANMGIGYFYNNISLSLQSHFQGEVLRRDLDLFSTDQIAAMGLSEPPRTETIAPWISFDAKISYEIKFIELGVVAENLLNSENYLAKNLQYPFDYKMIGRRIMLTSRISF